MAQGKEKSIKLNMVLNGIKGLMGILFPLISFPYASKILGVDGLGRYNFAASVVSYISLIAALGFNMYATREGACVRNDRSKFSKLASEIYSLNLLSTVISYVILALLLCLVPKFRDYSGLIIILSASVFLQTFGCEWVYSVYEEYAYITIRGIILQVISILLLFLVVKTPDDLYKYAWISVGASIAGNIANRILVRKYGRIRITGNVDFKSHLKPVFVLFAMNAAVTLYVNSDITILGMLRDDYTVGIYSVSVKVYSMVKTVLAAVVAVAIPRLSSLIGEGKRQEFSETAKDIYCTLITVVFPAIAGLVLLREKIVLLISDEMYLAATPSLAILAITLFFCLGAGFWGQAILIPVKKESVVLKVTMISALTNIVLNLILIPMWGEIAAALTTLISEMIAFIMCAWAGKREVSISGVGKTVIKSAVGCLIMVAYLLWVGTFELALFSHILVAVGGSVVLYFASQFALKNNAVYGVVNSIRRK